MELEPNFFLMDSGECLVRFWIYLTQYQSFKATHIFCLHTLWIHSRTATVIIVTELSSSLHTMTKIRERDSHLSKTTFEAISSYHLGGIDDALTSLPRQGFACVDDKKVRDGWSVHRPFLLDLVRYLPTSWWPQNLISKPYCTLTIQMMKILPFCRHAVS